MAARADSAHSAIARPIRAHEAETFLRLLCDVFGLDFGRARRAFFSEPLFDINRKWALFRGDEMVSILTTVPLVFGWGTAIGIAGVATRHDARGCGCASLLLREVVEEAERRGDGAALLFARQEGLYERLGFEVLDNVIRGEIDCKWEGDPPEAWETKRVMDRYDSWSDGSPHRLRRDLRRWNYWRWNLRICTEFGDGYLCDEGGVIRECVLGRPESKWHVSPGTEWLGLEDIAREIGVPLKKQRRELLLMGRHVPGTPQMFMTDQF